MTVTFGGECGKKTEVYVDGEYKGALYPKEIIEYGLKNEEQISEDTLERMMIDTLLKRAKHYVMEILIKSDRTEAELKKKLKEKGYAEETSVEAIEYVKSYHYIDELRTAENYIRSRIRENSEKEIRYKLSGKGISEETIDLAYERIIEIDELENPEIDAAVNFVKRKVGNELLNSEDLTYEDKQKLMAAAYRKGFRQESIREALKKLTQNY